MNLLNVTATESLLLSIPITKELTTILSSYNNLVNVLRIIGDWSQPSAFGVSLSESSFLYPI